MLAIFLFIVAILFSLAHLAYAGKWTPAYRAEVFLSYVLLLCVGVMSTIGAFMHLVMGPETAHMIGWAPGSPFQFEIGAANLAFAFLGLMSYSIRGSFWEAAIFGFSVFVLGCFVGHVINYFETGNTAPYNIGIAIWFYDLILPFILLGTLAYLRNAQRLEKN